MNRVYTEWYRNRGYSFDITNSTAYDQAFVYGRPIYSSISRIVDAIFNEYVRRQGQIAPYFTSFCNGTTATCQGLSQWGTVTLANQGYTPLQILRSYYPNDIEIVQTNIITNVISSYPGTPLRTGSTGLDVQTIQTYLTRIRRNYPAIPAISDPAGTFGSSTNAAVTKFQSIFNLTPDGIVGKSTWYKISSLYAAVAKLAELNSEGNTLGIGTVPPSSTLRQGSREPDVITLQYLLNLVSEYYPGIPAPTQDGIFGSGTRQSVIAFQQIMGLQADGIVGTATWRALYNTYLGIGQNAPSPGPGPDPEPGTITYVVQPGDSLWIIAQRYGTTVDAIKRLNGLLRRYAKHRPGAENPCRAGTGLHRIHCPGRRYPLASFQKVQHYRRCHQTAERAFQRYAKHRPGAENPCLISYNTRHHADNALLSLTKCQTHSAARAFDARIL